MTVVAFHSSLAKPLWDQDTQRTVRSLTTLPKQTTAVASITLTGHTLDTE